MTYWSKGRWTRRLLAVLLVAAFAYGGWMANEQFTASSLAEGCDSVREAVLASARQCCAIEGSYPSSIEYLEEHYGLSVNHQDYLITYDSFASNLAPEVTVTVR